MNRPRLTRAEIDVLMSCCGFVDAGEVSGGPLEGESDRETKRKCSAFVSAWRKLQMMADQRDASDERRKARTS